MCKEVISLVEDINRHSASFEICGILDDNPELAGKSVSGHPVLGPINGTYLAEDCKAVLTIATHRNIALRSKVGERLGLSRDKWARIIHPQATVAQDARVDPGVILYPGARVGPGTSLGLNSFLYYNSVLHHDSSLGEYTQVCAGVLIAGYVTVGHRCYLGIGSVLRDNIRIADDTLVAMGSVVTRDVSEPGRVLKGVPAREV
jgi:sugar O-acyltransferase (sialic acid O-acetyltransferase NeuD family)